MEPSPESGGDEPPPSAPEPDTGRSGRAPLVVALALLLVGVGVAVALVVGGDDSDNTASPTSTTAVTTTIAAPTTSGAATAPAAVDPVTGLPTGRFTIVGRQIVDPDGNVFVPMGANVAVRQGGFEEGYAFNWNGTATGRVADVKAWGWNTVRATLVCDLDGTGPTVDELNAGIDAFIEEYTRQRVVVMVECHDITGDNLGPTDPKVQALFPFWDRLATKWKDNPYVWFNFYNEPQGTTTAAGVDNWLDLQRDALGRLRAIAPTSIFVADIPGAAQGLGTLTGDDPITRLGDGQCNVLYGWHSYGAVGNDDEFGSPNDWDNEAASLANHRKVFEFLRDNDIPMVIGEVGDPLTLDEWNAGQPIWNRYGARSVMALAPEFGVGLLWWHGTGDSGVFLTYSLMAERHEAPWSAATTGEGLSDGGRRFWEASKNQPAPTRFTGDLAAGNCG